MLLISLLRAMAFENCAIRRFSYKAVSDCLNQYILKLDWKDVDTDPTIVNISPQMFVVKHYSEDY